MSCGAPQRTAAVAKAAPRHRHPRLPAFCLALGRNNEAPQSYCKTPNSSRQLRSPAPRSKNRIQSSHTGSCLRTRFPLTHCFGRKSPDTLLCRHLCQHAATEAPRPRPTTAAPLPASSALPPPPALLLLRRGWHHGRRYESVSLGADVSQRCAKVWRRGFESGQRRARVFSSRWIVMRLPFPMLRLRVVVEGNSMGLILDARRSLFQDLQGCSRACLCLVEQARSITLPFR